MIKVYNYTCMELSSQNLIYELESGHLFTIVYTVRMFACVHVQCTNAEAVLSHEGVKVGANQNTFTILLAIDRTYKRSANYHAHTLDSVSHTHSTSNRVQTGPLRELYPQQK